MATIYLVIIIVVALATVPLMIITKGGRMTEGRRLWARLHLLDRQIVDPNGRMAGCVDDLELA